MPSTTTCPFCHLPDGRIIDQNMFALAIRDAYPVSPGHTLIIPRRHVDSFFAATADERLAMFELLDRTRTELEQELAPAGYNIGINDGQAAGQTVAHLHLHFIPRFNSDIEDPRGGIRWVLPTKARYWP